ADLYRRRYRPAVRGLPQRASPGVTSRRGGEPAAAGDVDLRRKDAPMRILYYIAIMLSAATAGMGLCHVLQAPPRMLWSRQLWVDSTVHGGLYSLFGSVGAVLNVGAVVALGILAWKERRSPERARVWL